MLKSCAIIWVLAVLFAGQSFTPTTVVASGAPTADPMQEGVQARAEAAAGRTRERVEVTLHDLELTDQDGARVRFRSDIIGDRVAVVIPFYTTCTTAYPILIFMFTRLQEMLGERLGRDVVLVSVSVDPKTDIPVRLKAFSRRQKAKSGWVFLSGDRVNLGRILLGVGVLFSPNIDDHNHIPITLVGKVESDWRRFHGFPSPEQIMAEISRSLNDREES